MKHKILIVDDEKDLRDLISYFLTRANYEVALAEDGCVGFEKVKSWNPDLVISDIRMPVCDGFELLKRISDVPDDETRVMFISGYVGGDEDELRKNPHCVGFIPKPVNRAELLEMVKQALPA
ncbi:response regulator [Bdellovibrio sp. HCB185ZH]|uniref:response regulator n=1 Tax=Bdellovibrio sp. HCB185ZH TaxID=3394235 RepID=UPI0039A5D551